MNIPVEIMRIAKELVAIEFDTREQMNDYLEKHPGADKSLHHVKDHTEKELNKFHMLEPYEYPKPYKYPKTPKPPHPPHSPKPPKPYKNPELTKVKLLKK